MTIVCQRTAKFDFLSPYLPLYSIGYLNSAYANSNATLSVPDLVPVSDSTLKEGWYKTKRGMTIDEIRVVLKEDIKRIAPENRKRYKTDCKSQC